MNRRRTALGLKLVAGGLLTIFAIFILSFLVFLLAPLIAGSGLLVCLSGARGRPRWAIFSALTLLVLSVSAFTLGESQTGLPNESERQDALLALSFFLFAGFVASFLTYADAICRESEAFSLRRIFWLLGAHVGAIALLRMGVLLDLVTWPTLEDVLTYSFLPFYLILTGGLVALSRIVSNPDHSSIQPVEP